MPKGNKNTKRKAENEATETERPKLIRTRSRGDPTPQPSLGKLKTKRMAMKRKAETKACSDLTPKSKSKNFASANNNACPEMDEPESNGSPKKKLVRRNLLSDLTEGERSKLPPDGVEISVDDTEYGVDQNDSQSEDDPAEQNQSDGSDTGSDDESDGVASSSDEADEEEISFKQKQAEKCL